MSSNSDYLLSFELEDKLEPLFIHGDPEGLRKFAELLLALAENTPEGRFDHEHLWIRQGLSGEGKGGQKIRHVKVYCWRGDTAHGAPDYSLIQQQKSLGDHGYTLAAIKEWRTQEGSVGRPSTLNDFIEAHELCLECRATGIQFSESRAAQLCSICGGTGKRTSNET
jgi:hypothetical protein